MPTLTEWLTIAAMGVSVLVSSTGVFYYFTERRKARIEQQKVVADSDSARAAAALAQFGVNIELSKYIDDRVEARVKDTLDEVRNELGALRDSERVRTIAMSRILRAIANQWPAGHPGPLLDPADIAAVEDTIPERFLKGSPS